jgi:uncharacterized protein YbaP (TraB family)
MLIARTFFLLLLCWAFPLADAAEDRLPFWLLEREGARCYVLGSIHLARPDFYPLRAEILELFRDADALVVEVDISADQAGRLQTLTLEQGSYPEGKSIHDELSNETWLQLAKHLEDAGLAPELMEQLRPGLVVTMLTTVRMMALGLEPALGIDRHFLDRAHGLAPAPMPVLELESLESQLALLFDFPEADLLVQQSLAELDNLGPVMEELITAWKRGDMAELGRLLLDETLTAEPRFAPVYERLFYQRNRAMVSALERFSVPGRTLFVVVGSGHLVGDRGIISLMHRAGFSARQL